MGKKITKVQEDRLPIPGVRFDAYQEIFSLVDDGSITINDIEEFNRVLVRIAPSNEQKLRWLVPRDTIWGNVNFDVQMEMLGLVRDEVITVVNEESLIRVMEKVAPVAATNKIEINIDPTGLAELMIERGILSRTAFNKFKEEMYVETVKLVKMYQTTPDNSPELPDAPQKPEVFPEPRQEGDDDEPLPVKRRLNMGVGEDDAQDEEGLTRLDLIDANTIDVKEGYDENEPNPIKRAFMLTTDALVQNATAMVGRGDRSDLIYVLEQIAKALIGEGTLESYKLRMQAIGEGW